MKNTVKQNFDALMNLHRAVTYQMKDDENAQESLSLSSTFLEEVKGIIEAQEKEKAAFDSGYRKGFRDSEEEITYSNEVWRNPEDATRKKLIINTLEKDRKSNE